MKQVRFGILGTARIANRQVKAMNKANHCKPIAIASRSYQKAKSFAKSHGLDPVDGYNQLLEREDIDAVYLPLPNDIHTTWAVKAMQEGKHVLVDKPLAISTTEIDRLQQVSSDTGKYVMEGFMYRFHPVFDQLVNLIKKNKIGKIAHIELELGHNISGYLDQSDNYRYYQDQGGGALFDLGSYGLDLFQYLLKRLDLISDPEDIDLVHAYQQKFDLYDIFWTNSNQIPADHTTHALFQTNDTITCQLTSSFVFHRKIFWISGDNGYIEIGHITSSGEKLIKIHTYSPYETEEIKIPETNTYAKQFDLFSTSILEKSPPPISLAESRHTMKLIEQISQLS